MKPLLCTFLLCAACNEVVSTRPDAAAPDVDAEVEVEPDAVPEPCDLSAPFGAAVALTELNTADDDEFVTLMPDERTIYVANNHAAPGTANVDLYVATRTALDQPFGALVPVTAVNTDSDDRSPSISADGLELYFHSSRSGNYDLYVATRTSTAVGFGAPVALAGVNTTAIEADPEITADGETLYFDRSADDVLYQTFRATRGPTGFGNAVAVTSINGPDAMRAAPSDDDRTIYFSSARAGTAGNLDVWVATRASTSDPWSDITNVAELNTTNQDTVDWISPDGCRAYVTRKTGAAFDVYVASRP